MAEGSASVKDTAVAAALAGICVLPARPDGSKRPWPNNQGTWDEYKTRRPTKDELSRWFHQQEAEGLGFVCGAVSGGLEMFEFEDMATYQAFLSLAEVMGVGDLVERVRSGYEESTPGGGIHWFYRCPDDVRQSKKLAQRPCPGAEVCDLPKCSKGPTSRHVLVETRGNEGWGVVAPSGGRTHETGGSYTLLQGGIPTIETLTSAEREELWRVAKSLDEMPVREEAPPPPRSQHEPGGTRPGEIYNAQGTWDDVLAPHGWRRLSTRGGLTYWRRPGKDRGVSATTGLRNPGDPTSDLLWVFSTSTPFEAEQGYSKYRAYAVLNHAGDWGAAARDLRSLGYAAPDGDVGPLVAASAPERNNQPETMPVSIPERPQEPPCTPYRFEAVFGPDHFIGRYVAYASQRTDAPHEYHEAVAAQLLGAMTPGVRARLSAWPNGLATNMYVVLVGDSTKSRKSTAINEGKRMLQAASPVGFPSPVFPDHFSEAALLEQLAMRPAHASVWCPDELGQVLEDIEKRAQLKDVLLTLYDSPPSYDNARHSKRVKGEASTVEDVDRVQKPHWNILGATTPAVFDSLSTRTVQSGLLPRFAYIWPEGRPPRMGLRESTPSMEAEFNDLAYYLKALSGWAQTAMRTGVEVVFTPGTIEALDRYMHSVEDTGETIIARLPAMAVKLAMVSAMGEEIPAVPRVVIEMRDVERAIALASKWQRYALRFGTEIGGYDIHERKFQQRIVKALAFLRANEGRALKSRVMRHMHINAKDMDELQRTLIEMDEIEVYKAESAGRPGTYWAILKGDEAHTSNMRVVKEAV